MGESSDWSKPYNGSGQKAWGRIDGRGNLISGTGTTITPTELSTQGGYKPYRLQYLKENSTVESVSNYETGLTLCKEWNMVEVGSGIVIREKAAAAAGVSGEGNIHNPYLLTTMLKHKTLVNTAIVYKNNAVDRSWIPKGDNVLQTNTINFDPTAVYHVTYTMLGSTLAALIIGSVATNLRGTVTDVVQWANDAERRLSVVETQKAEKDTKVTWIKPSLMNGWVYFGLGSTVGYTKIDNVVYLKGRIKDGSLASTAFHLPIGYRPKEDLIYLGRAYENGSNRIVPVGVESNGKVSFYDTNKEVHLEGIEFLAEQ